MFYSPNDYRNYLAHRIYSGPVYPTRRKTSYCGTNDYRNYLAHFGIKGMKWGKNLFGKKDEKDQIQTSNATNRGGVSAKYYIRSCYCYG